MKEFILALLISLFLLITVYTAFDGVRNSSCISIKKDYSSVSIFSKIPVRCVSYVDVRYYKKDKNLLESK